MTFDGIGRNDLKHILNAELREMVWDHYQITKDRFDGVEQYVEKLVDDILKSQKLHQGKGE